MKLTSVILSILFFVFLTLGVYVFWIDDVINYTYQIVFGILVVLFVVVYILQAEIDWYWWLRNPPEMPAGLERQIAVMIPFYRNLDSIEKKRFRDRLMLWINAKEHLVKGLDVFPEEVKSLIAAYGVMMTFGIEKYLLYPYERVVMYPHPFPSPQHQFLHNSEIHDEDGSEGVVIFNATPMMQGFNQPKQNYNIVLHEYAKGFMNIYPDKLYPSFSDEKLNQLNELRGIDFPAILKTTGMKELNHSQVAIEHFLMTPAAFQKTLPEEYDILCRIFNLNPLNATRPVLEIRKIGDNPLKGQ